MSEVENNSKKFLKPYLKPYYKYIVFTCLCSFILACCGAVLSCLLGPSLSIFVHSEKEVYSLSDMFGQNFSTIMAFMTTESYTRQTLLMFLPQALIITSAVKFLIQIIQAYFWEGAAEKIAQNLRADLYKIYLNKNPYPEQTLTCEENISSIITIEIRTIRDYIARQYGNLPREIIQIVTFFFILLMLSHYLFFIFIVFLCPCAVVVRFLGKKLKKRARDYLVEYSQVSEWLQQRLIGLETIKHYRTEDKEIHKFKKLTTLFRKKMYKQSKTQARTSPILESIAGGAFVAVILISIYEIYRGNINSSVVMSFFATTALLGQSIGKLGSYLNFSQEGKAAIERLTNANRELVVNKVTPFIEKSFCSSKNLEQSVLSLNNVSVVYPGKTKSCLVNFTYEFKKNNIYFIHGPSGSGKTTLLKAMLGLLAPKDGSINYYLSSQKQKNIGYMPQNVIMAPMSIYETVAYPDAFFEESRIIHALKSVRMYEFCRNLPNGLDTRLTSGEGSGVSGGQAQRLLLSRVFYHEYQLIILDEASSSLDLEVEKIIYKNLRKLVDDKKTTIIQVSHRLSTKHYCDYELFLKDSKLIYTRAILSNS
jgi:ABC-type multidrug transport system fused ATPase/permease subunit